MASGCILEYLDHAMTMRIEYGHFYYLRSIFRRVENTCVCIWMHDKPSIKCSVEKIMYIKFSARQDRFDEIRQKLQFTVADVFHNYTLL